MLKFERYEEWDDYYEVDAVTFVVRDDDDCRKGEIYYDLEEDNEFYHTWRFEAEGDETFGMNDLKQIFEKLGVVNGVGKTDAGPGVTKVDNCDVMDGSA